MKDLKEILADNDLPSVRRMAARARALNARKPVTSAACKCKGTRRVVRKASLFPRVPEVAIKCDGCA